MKRLLRSLSIEPRPDAPPRGVSDWRLLVALVVAMLLEAILRDDLRPTSVSVLLGVALTPSLLWRRSHPLLASAAVFTTTGFFEGAAFVTGWSGPELHSAAFMLILPYALFRWGSGREALLGLPIILVSAGVGLVRDDLAFGELLGGFAVLLTPIAMGTAVRYRERVRVQELRDVRANERSSLARELHDTVAHHVSAIAVRAQAGVATAANDPQTAVDALRVIGAEASRTLDEMRAMVRVLRDDEAAQLAPAPRVEDLQRLAGGGEGQTRVDVEIHGETATLSPALSGAVYRLAQESVTNARRHARGATRVRVEVIVEEGSVQLRVHDDGDPTSAAARAGGYGLVGMAERAQLLGGTLHAGPGQQRGWTVTAVLPQCGTGS